MGETYEGAIAKFKREARKEGWEIGVKYIANILLENYSFEEVADFLEMDQKEIENILNKNYEDDFKLLDLI